MEADDKSERTYSMCLLDGRETTLHVYWCANKGEAQSIVRKSTGLLPSDLTDCFWMDSGMIHIALQYDAKQGRIAHEAFHAAASFFDNPNDYTLIRPKGGDFGFIPAEVAANLCEQIVEAVNKSKGCPACSTLDDFEAWLRTVCFQRPTTEAYDLAQAAWCKASSTELYSNKNGE